MFGMTEHNTNANRGLPVSTGFKAAGAFCFPGELRARQTAKQPNSFQAHQLFSVCFPQGTPEKL